MATVAKIVIIKMNPFHFFREDSDIVMPYGQVVKKNMNGKNEFVSDILAGKAGSEILAGKTGSEILAGKTGLVAWFVSHCHTTSKREVLVEDLKKHLPGDSIKVIIEFINLKNNSALLSIFLPSNAKTNKCFPAKNKEDFHFLPLD